jgi:hypothetical protein
MKKQKEEKKLPRSVKIVFPTWKTNRAFRAIEPLTCAGYGCGRTIEVGEFFTRHKPQAASYHYSVHAFCRNCVPFVETEQTYEALRDEYLHSEWGQADEQEWQERYGDRPMFGPSIFLGRYEQALTNIMYICISALACISNEGLPRGLKENLITCFGFSPQLLGMEEGESS